MRHSILTAAMLLAATTAVAQAPGGPPQTQVPAVNYTPPAKRVLASAGVVAEVEKRVAAQTTPRLPDGHPDLNGMWSGQVPTVLGPGRARGLYYLEADQAVVQRGAYTTRPMYRPELWDKVNALNFSTITTDPQFDCKPSGAPRLGAPGKIVQTAKEAVLFYGDEFKIVPLDGRKHTEEDKDFDNYRGLPIGHWEGDTLVIESIGFNDLSWLGWEGYFHTHDMTLTERITRKGDYFLYSYVVNDPEVLMAPWTSETYVKGIVKNPNARLEEVAPCEEHDAKSLPDPWFRG